MSYFSKMNGGNRGSVSIRQIQKTVRQPTRQSDVKAKYDPKSPTKISQDKS